jgi:periplasmic protein CpxP/Spy
MSKVTLLSAVAVILLLCNIGLMGLYWKKSNGTPGGEKDGGPRKEIIHRLNFNREQVIQYDEMIRAHRSLMHQKDEQMRLLKKALYNTLNGGEAIETSQDSIIARIGETQQEIEHINLAHFADIGSLCRPDQQSSYKALVSDLSSLFMHRRPPPPGKRP